MISRFARVWIWVALAALVTAPLFAGPISTEITTANPFLKASDNVELTFTMTNDSDQAVRVLRWQTPFDGIEGNLFEVSRNGDLVPYLGRVYKRGTPGPEHFMLLQPGESVATGVELSAFYNMRFTGEYTIRFRGTGFDHLPAKGAHGDVSEMGSNAVVLWVDGEEPPVLPESRLQRWTRQDWSKAKPGSDNPGGCSNQELNKLDSALVAARGIAAESYAYLAAGPDASSQRYAEWFGAYSSSRWNTVENNFQAISDALDNAPIEWDCTCNQNYYAYVYPSQPYKIYLCRVFWRASTTGTDSKAGTLVHEMSHFNVVAGTDDVTYGQSSCRALADANPNQAIKNADSHEYFAENSPSLP